MLCENCHLNEAEVKLTVKSKDGMQEKWVCSTCAQGDNPWTHQEQSSYHHQDDIEEAFVVKQILQHLATKHGINFQEMAFQEEKRCPTCHMTLKDIAHVGKFGCSNCYHSSYHKLALKKKIEEKKQYLQQLIDEQDFEQAAIVRDEIKSLSEESEVQHDE